MKIVPLWLLKQLTPAQQEEAKRMLLQGIKTTTIAEHFKAAYTPYNYQRREFTRTTKAQKIVFLQNLGRMLGRTPTSEDYQRATGSKPTKYAFAFGSWNNALVVAGFTPKHLKKARTDLENIPFTNEEGRTKWQNARHTRPPNYHKSRYDYRRAWRARRKAMGLSAT